MKSKVTKFCGKNHGFRGNFAVQIVNFAVIMLRKESNGYNYALLTKFQDVSPAIPCLVGKSSKLCAMKDMRVRFSSSSGSQTMKP